MTGPWYEWRGDELHLRLRIQPRAARDEIVGPLGDRLKVRITAPPVEGRANAHLIKFLAKAFGVPRSEVQLVSGDTGRDKSIAIRQPKELPESAAILDSGFGK